MDVKTKEATALVSPVEDDQSQHGEFEVILSTSALDRDGDELDPADWKQPLPEYITFDVDHGMSVEKTVGGGKPFINASGQIQVRGQFSSRPLAQDTRTMLKEGIIRNVSVAYMERKNSEGKIERELLNGAFVAIPANTEAVVLSSKAAKAKVVEQLVDEPEFTVRVSGGAEALKKALEESGIAAYEVVSKHPLSHDRTGISGPTGAFLDGFIKGAGLMTGHWCESDDCCPADGSTDGANAPTKSLSKSAADPAADAAGPPADDDIELAKAKALALAIQLS